MQLRRIEVRDFRKIGHRVIDELGDGLNVVVGDNEAGKSTLLAALRAVFFERHRVGGDVAKAMQPYGGTLRPRIDVDFEIDGKAWSLGKAFCQRQEASLSGPGEKIVGDAVEDRLAELFGFTPPGRGGSKPEEHQGTHGLLWVEQGTQRSLGVGAGRNALAAALEREVGQVTGGDRGRALIAAAAERRDAHWTKMDKPRGEAKTLRDGIEALDGERDALLNRQRDHDGRIMRLADVAGILARHTKDDRLSKAVEAVTLARRAVASAEALTGTFKDAEAKRAESLRNRAEASDHRTRRAAMIDALQKAQSMADKATIAADDARAIAEHRAAQAQTVDGRAKLAREAREQADAAVRGLDEALARRQGESMVNQQRERLLLAETQATARREALARAEARLIDREAVAELAALEKSADRAEADVKAASVRIGFEAESLRLVTVDGISHPLDAPLALTRDAVLDLEGFGRLTIRPGGGTADLRAKAEAAQSALALALRRHAVPSSAAAQTALGEKMEAVKEAASLAKSLAALAPKGLDVLRQEIESETARLARPLSPDAAAVANTADHATLDEARRAQQPRLTEEQAAEAEAKIAASQRQTAATEAATLAERAAAARRQREAAMAELATARSATDDDLLVQRLALAEAALMTATATADAAQRALDAADPESARLVLERTERAEREIRKDIETLEREKRDLQAELRGSGQDGIGERLSEIDDLLVAKRARLKASELEASASRMLYDTLIEAQRESKERWLAPVRSRVSPYLKLIQPDSEIVIDEQTLEIQGFSRSGFTEAFNDLSMGAREQVAVITRLALADVLRASGHPAAIILDDALVNTDETRLDRMHNVLTRAAQSLQILILTCREGDFLKLGGKIHRM